MSRMASDTVQAGENIISLTVRLLGDPARWTELVRANNLRAPYITEEPRDRTLSPGEAVLYPTTDAAPTAPVSASQLEVRTFKRDLRARGGDLSLLRGQSTDAGLPNLRVALERRLRTLIGRHPFHPEYGSLMREHVGKVADGPRVHLVKVDAERAILQDPRVSACEVTVVWQNEFLAVDAVITPVALGTPIRIRVPVA